MRNRAATGGRPTDMRRWAAAVIVVAVAGAGCTGGETPATPTSTPNDTSVPTSMPVPSEAGPIHVEAIDPGQGFAIPDYTPEPTTTTTLAPGVTPTTTDSRGRPCFTPAPAHLVGVDPDTGDIEWDVTIPFPQLWWPLVADDVVVMPIASGWGHGAQLVTVAADGTPMWQATFGGSSLRTLPVVTSSTVVVSLGAAGSKTLAALRVTDGAVLWAWTAPATDFALPLEASADLGLVYDIERNGAVTAVDLDSGEVVWTRQPGGGMITRASLGDRGLYLLFHTRLLALDPETGRRLWNAPQPSDEPHISEVEALESGVVLAWSTNGQRRREGRVVAALDPDDGTPLWEIDRHHGSQLVLVESTLIDVGDSATGRGPVEAIDPLTGETMWRLESDSRTDVDLTAVAPDIVVLYQRTPDRSLVVIDAETGDPRYTAGVAWPLDVRGRPLLIDDHIVAPVTEGGQAVTERSRVELMSFDRGDGSLQWQTTLPAPYRAAPLQVGDTILTLAANPFYACI